MMVDISALRDLVIAVIRNRGEWAYYAAPVEFWVLDWDAWASVFIEAGHLVPEIDAAPRGGVRVLNEASADRALSALSGNRLLERDLGQALREELPIRDWDQVSHLFPAVFVDFDLRHMTSQYSEMLELERYVPAGWVGELCIFFDQIPVRHRYWEDGSCDYLKMALSGKDTG